MEAQNFESKIPKLVGLSELPGLMKGINDSMDLNPTHQPIITLLDDIVCPKCDYPLDLKNQFYCGNCDTRYD